MPQLDGTKGNLLRDIQGNLLRAYDLPFARYIFLRIADAAEGRAWLGRVIDSVTSVTGWDGKPTWTFNVAFSFSGLQALGLPAETLASFPDAFRIGMAKRAATILGDSGPSHPDKWQFGADPTILHALVAIHAQSEYKCKDRYAWHKEMLQTAASPVFERETAMLPGKTEHFGYRDGFGQPHVQRGGEPACPGQGTPTKAGGWNPLALGEFVLGYEDETGCCEPMPKPDVLGLNGSYMVVRMLRQNVAAFRDFLRRGAEKIGRDPEWLAARMVGRWRSGAPLALTPDRDNADLGANLDLNNDFRYKGDEKGLLCPRNAHIRRANPRDAMDGDPNVMVSRHRILRRGMPYGAPLPEGAIDDGVDRGIVFMAVNASITRQFEFIQKLWVNDGDFLDGGQEKDPVIGNHEPGAVFTIPATPVSKCLTGLSSFVATRGGGYFFLPGINALRYLSSSQTP